jgi:hypothetical protein
MKFAKFAIIKVMAKPKVGHDYRLDIKQDMRNESITWVNNSSKKLYLTWGEIDGRIVKVKTTTMILSTFYIVALLEKMKDPFYTSGKMLMELTRRLPIPCTCELEALLNSGCRCGAFKKEQAAKQNR